MNEVTTLSVVQRAALAVRSSPELKKELADLAEGSKHITTITNQDGRAQVHSALMALKNRRIEIEKIGKEARDDATKFSKAVIAEEDALVGIISPEEDRLQALRDSWDDRIEAERQAAIAAEQARQDGIRASIAAIRGTVETALKTPTAAAINQLVLDVASMPITEALFAELTEAARLAQVETLARLHDLHDAAKAREAESARLAAERAELDRQRAEQEARDKVERDRIAAEQAAENERLRKEREAFERDQAAARAAQAAEANRLRQDREALEAAQKAEQDRKDREARELLEAEERAQREREEEAERQRRNDFVPEFESVVHVLSTTYGQTRERVMEWLPTLVKGTRKAA
jgi:hypothetical protein